MENRQQTKSRLIIRPLNNNETPPWPLLLLADPSETQVNAYLQTGICRVGELDNRVVAVFVLSRTSSDVCELMNIAVDESLQGQGFGKQLMQAVINEAGAAGSKILEVGTGNSSLDELAFYQKSGFRITGVDKDFFIRNYPEPIFENGIQCMDMVRLSRQL